MTSTGGGTAIRYRLYALRRVTLWDLGKEGTFIRTSFCRFGCGGAEASDTLAVEAESSAISPVVDELVLRILPCRLDTGVR